MSRAISEGTSWGMHRKWRETPVCKKCRKVKVWRSPYREKGLCASCLKDMQQELFSTILANHPNFEFESHSYVIIGFEQKYYERIKMLANYAATLGIMGGNKKSLTDWMNYCLNAGEEMLRQLALKREIKDQTITEIEKYLRGEL